jgi:hypothetical protein
MKTSSFSFTSRRRATSLAFMRSLALATVTLSAACDGARGAGGGDQDAAAPLDGPDGAASAVRIIRGDPNESNWFSLTIEGHGLANDEGRLVIARIGHPQRLPERLGVGQVRIQNGAFRIEFPQGCEGFLYKQKFLFIDVNADGSCTLGVDRVYRDFRFLDGDITLTLTDSTPAAPLDTQMLLSSTDPPASFNCEALNEPWPEL